MEVNQKKRNQIKYGMKRRKKREKGIKLIFTE